MSDCLSLRLSLATEINIKHFGEISFAFRLTPRHTRFLYFCLRFELRTMHVISFVCVLQFWMLFVLYAHVCYICVCVCVCVCVYLRFFFLPNEIRFNLWAFCVHYKLLYFTSTWQTPPGYVVLQWIKKVQTDVKEDSSKEEWEYTRNRWERKAQQKKRYYEIII